MPDLVLTISGLSEYSISFENYCVPCKLQRRCRYGKTNPLVIKIDCKDLMDAYQKKRYQAMKKAQKEADIEDTYEDIEDRVNVNLNQIFSGVWQKKVKDHKEEIFCINSKRMDSMFTSQRGGEWWQVFIKVMKKVYEECKKQTNI